VAQTMLDDVQISVSPDAVIKVDMVHENSKDLKLEVQLDDTMLTLGDAVTRRVQLRRTSMDVDPSEAASSSNTASQSNTATASIFPETHSSPSPIREQSRLSPPSTQSTPVPHQTQPSATMTKAMKNARGKSQSQQRKMSPKATKDKQPFKQTSAIMQANLKFVMGQPMLTADELGKAGQACIYLHNYYIQNYESSLDILVSYKDHHFLVGDELFIVTFSDLYDFFNLTTLDFSLMHCFTL
jgi:hypothetical protein